MSYANEFETVDVILSSTAETRGVDAFALSLIKAERQIRRLLTHLVFQFECFSERDISQLRQVLGENRKVYFEGFERGLNAIYPDSVSTLIGEEYARLNERLIEAIRHRNKIFHGQLTSKNLSRDDLLSYVNDIRLWCSLLAHAAQAEFSYDGFGRNSFQKSKVANLSNRFLIQLGNVGDYEVFIKNHLQRP